MGNKATKLPKEDLKMLIEKTSFTEKQIKQWHKGFMVRLISPLFLRSIDTIGIGADRICVKNKVCWIRRARREAPVPTHGHRLQAQTRMLEALFLFCCVGAFCLLFGKGKGSFLLVFVRRWLDLTRQGPRSL